MTRPARLAAGIIGILLGTLVLEGAAGDGERRTASPCSCSGRAAAFSVPAGATPPGSEDYTATQLYDVYSHTLPRFHHPNGTTYYVVEGDLLYTEEDLEQYVFDRLDLQRFYRAAVEGAQVPKRVSFSNPKFAEAAAEIEANFTEQIEKTLRNKLVVHLRPDGTEDSWPDRADPAKKRDFASAPLRYCILKKEFTPEARYRTALADMQQVTQGLPGPHPEGWEKLCGVRFEHVAGLDEVDLEDLPQDGSPPAGVDFVVRCVETSGFIAAAFFPSDPVSKHQVLLGPSYFTIDRRGFNRPGVMRHELGHVLGFRHEHIRPEAPLACSCEDLSRAKPLGKYDPHSVMHYYCGGAGTKHLKFSADDKRWSKGKYGDPFSGEESDTAGAVFAPPPALEPAAAVRPKSTGPRVDAELQRAAKIVKELRLRHALQLKERLRPGAVRLAPGTAAFALAPVGVAGWRRPEILRYGSVAALDREIAAISADLDRSEFAGTSSRDLANGVKAIYGIRGSDSREEVEHLLTLIETTVGEEFQARYRAMYANSKSVALVVDGATGLIEGELHSSLRATRFRYISVKKRYGEILLGETVPLCDEERFYDQPTAGMCTAFLVGSDLFVTAGHCVREIGDVCRMRFVFGFRMGKDGQEPEVRIPNARIFRGEKLVHIDPNQDWAIVRVDREVTGRVPLKVGRSEALEESAQLYVIGHPAGLPTKYATGEVLKSDEAEDFFVSNLDTYGGNSGSPVFGMDHKVVGILISGADDFGPREILPVPAETTCYLSIKYPHRPEDLDKSGERVAKSSLFASRIAED